MMIKMTNKKQAAFLSGFCPAAALALLLCLPLPAGAASENIDIEARIVGPFDLIATQPLSFGDIIPDNTVSGEVTIDNAGTATENNVTLVGGTVQAGTFTLVDDTTDQVRITVPASTTITDGANSMTVDNFTLGASGDVNVLSGNNTNDLHVDVQSSPATGFTVGGRLVVPDNQPAGNYSGTVEITAAYD